MRRSTFLAGGAALAAAAACQPAAAQFNPNQPFVQQLTIGVSVPLSGDLKAYGIQISNGARAAVDEHNRYVAPLERVFAVRTFDDQDALAIGMTNVEIAAADSTIVGMIGNLTADVTVGSLPQYANVSMPLVVPASTLHPRGQGSGRVHRGCGRARGRAGTLLPAWRRARALRRATAVRTTVCRCREEPEYA